MQDTRPELRALPGSGRDQEGPKTLILTGRRNSGLMLLVSVLAGLIGVIFLYLAVISSLYALPMLLCSVLCFAYVGSFYLREYLMRRQIRRDAAGYHTAEPGDFKMPDQN